MRHRDFSRYISTDEDRRTVRRWLCVSAIGYGLLGLLVIGGSAVRFPQADTSHTVKEAGPIPMTTASNTIHTL